MSGDESDKIEFVGTKRVTIDLLDDTDDDDDNGSHHGAKKAVPVNSIIISTSSQSARKRSSSGVARAPISSSKQRARSLLGKTVHEAIDLCEDEDDAVMATSRQKGPFAAMTYQGRSQETAMSLDDSSSSEEDLSDSDDSSIVFVDQDGKKILPRRTITASESPTPSPYTEDSSDDDITTLRERMDQNDHQAHAIPATTTTATPVITSSATSAAPTCPTSPRSRDRDRNQLREARRAEMRHRNACGSIPSSPARKKAPASTLLKPVPFMGKSERVMQKFRDLESRRATKVPDVIMTNVSKTGCAVTEDMPASERDDFPLRNSSDDDDDNDELANRYLGNKKPASLPAHSDEKLASKEALLAENHSATAIDNDSVAASDALTDGSVRDGTVCFEEAEEYGDFGVNDIGQDNDDDNDDGNDADDDQPLECTFDDDTVVSVRKPAMRPTRRARRTPWGSDIIDDSADKENVKVVRRPMVPAATDRRLEAFADYDLVGIRDFETITGNKDDDEDSLPEGLFDNLDIDDDFASMNLVECLSSLSEDPKTGLPVRRFTVYGGGDDILHDFVITIQQSGIPGSGLGAFLKYLGARKLTADRRNMGIDALDGYEHFLLKTNRTLQARTPGGYGYSLTLTGENLHGNNNRLYWPKTMKEAYEAGEDFDRDELACKRSVSEGIGFLGMHLESHYKQSPKTVFSSPGNCMPLGNYGPFQKEDRKTESQFTVKSFIFGNAPNEWPFDVEEKLFGEQQIIDITDDATGSPHELARKNIAMYVNEVGHNNKSKQNVFICPRDGRAVQYFIKLASPMKKGDQIELLTNYGKVYETIRERKGYGWRNLNRGLPSNEDRASGLKRNLGDREDAENTIMLLNCPNLVSMIEFVKERIWLPVWTKAQASHASVNNSASRGDVSPPSSEQWIALRRIHWLRTVFLRRVCDLEEQPPPEYGYPYKSSYTYCRALLDSMEENRFPVAVESAESVFAIGEVIRQEIIEEMHYTMREKLLMPFDRSIWCPLAADLLEMLCDDVSVLLITTKGNPTPEEKMALRWKIIAATETSANDLRRSTKCGGVPNSLAFRSGTAEGSIISGSLRTLLGTVKCSKSFYVDNSTVPKGFLAGIVRMLAYYDSLMLAGVEPQQDDTFQLQVETSDSFVMAQYNGFDGSDKLRELGSLPRPIDSANTSIAINETWYLVWQVIFVVHTFLAEFLDGSDETLKILCSKVGVDYTLAQFAIARGMKRERDKGLRKRCSRKPQPRSQPRKSKKHLGRSKDLSARENTIKKRRKSLSKTGTNRDSAKAPPLKCASAIAPPLKCVSAIAPPLKGQPNGKPRPLAKEIWFGKADPKEIPGDSEGWTKRTFERQSGATKGDTDNYWYTPKLKKKLRSIKEVHRFVKALAKADNNEARAWKNFKAK